MTTFTKRAREAAEDATLNCGEYEHLCSKWYLKGAEYGARQMVEELRSVKPGEPYWWIGKEIANALESKLNERE